MGFLISSWMNLKVRLRQIFDVLRFTPFDTSTEYGRSKERYRRALLTAITSGISKSCMILVGIFSVPLVLSYLGKEQYGLWLTINSTIMWLTLSNLGLSLGLSNKLTEALARNDIEEARGLVASTFWLLIAIAFVLALCILPIFPLIKWVDLFNSVGIVSNNELLWIVIIVFVNLILSLPLGIIQTIYQAYQEGYYGQIWASIGSLANLTALFMVTYFKGGLLLLALATSAMGTVISLVNGLVLFTHIKPELLPRPKYFHVNYVKKIWSLSWDFFLLSVCSMIISQVGYIVIAKSLGPGEVTPYGVTSRILTYAQTFISLVQTPFWPAFVEAKERGDIVWAKKTFLRLLRITVLYMFLFALCVNLFGNFIILHWAGPNALASKSMLLAIGFHGLVSGVLMCYSVLLSGLSLIRVQLWLALTNATVTFLAMIFLVKVIGGSGVIWATFLGSLVVLGPVIKLANKSLRSINE